MEPRRPTPPADPFAGMPGLKRTSLQPSSQPQQQPVIEAEARALPPRALPTSSSDARAAELLAPRPPPAQQQMAEELLRRLEQPQPHPTQRSSVVELAVCTGKACTKAGSTHLLAALLASAPPGVVVRGCSCRDSCKTAPNVQVREEGHKKVLLKRAPCASSVLGSLSFE